MYEEGYKDGREHHRKEITTLARAMLADGRKEELYAALTDEETLERYLEEYGISIPISEFTL